MFLRRKHYSQSKGFSMTMQLHDTAECLYIYGPQSLLRLHKNKYTGLVITTDKGGGIQHEGIYAGIDDMGDYWAFHNHPDQGGPALVRWDRFTKGAQVYFKAGECVLSQHAAYCLAIHEFSMGKPYSLLGYNCQHFASKACNGRSTSWQLDAIVGGLVAFVAGIAAGAVLEGALSEA